MKALITGITGQDGSYLAEFLLKKGYEVYGMYRRSSVETFERINHIKDKINLICADLIDQSSLNATIRSVNPDEVYNLAAQSFVPASWTQPILTGDVTALGVTRILEAIRHINPKIKFYQASCYSEDTRVLTEGGLKYYHEVKKGEIVYTVNPKTNKLELKPIEKIHKYDYEGKMFNFKSRRMNILVTPNHKMLFKKDNGNLFFEDANNVEKLFKYDKTSDISLPSPEWAGKKTKKIIFSEFIDINKKHYNCYKNLVDSMSIRDYLYLLGLYIGDGYTAPKKKKERACSAREFIKKRNNKGQFVSHKNKIKEKVIYESNRICFAIPIKDKARPKLIKTLKKYHIKPILSNNTIEFSSFTLARMFKQTGENVYEKHIPRWVLNLHPDLLTYLFNGMIDSDGHRRKIKNERQIYTTTSKRLAENFVELCYKIRRIPKVSVRKGGRVWFKKEKRFLRTFDNYVINVSYKRKNKLYKANIKRIDYKGVVWCLTVKDNHNFLVERNGFFAFSGNSSEMFGKVQETPQTERTPFYPRSPYGVAKVFAFWMTKNYRESYGMFCSNGILFNHESSRRGKQFVTRKITDSVAKIKLGLQKELFLGSLDAKRDWGYALDFVKAMWLMLQHDKPDDFVIATGETHSVREFCEAAFSHVGLNYEDYVKTDPKFLRPAEVDLLVGDYSKAKKELGWEPKVKFKELVGIMVDSDIAKHKKEIQ